MNILEWEEITFDEIESDEWMSHALKPAAILKHRPHSNGTLSAGQQSTADLERYFDEY